MTTHFGFTAKIEAGAEGRAFVSFPYDVYERFGTRGEILVNALFDGEPYTGYLAKEEFPQHTLEVSEAIRKRIGKGPGDFVRVTLWQADSADFFTRVRYPPLPEFIREALTNIEPSGGQDLFYYPCRVTLKNGETLDTVYIEPEKPYFRFWGVYPEDDKAKKWIRIEDLVKVEDSPTRLPAKFANEIYRAGESGMGYCIFTVVFADGSRQAYSTGNAVDFIAYPTGKGPTDVVEVLPHEGRNSRWILPPDWYWCLYSEPVE